MSSADAPLAPGVRVLVRDEEWLVRGVQTDTPDGTMIKAVGVSEFVQDLEATFFTELDEVQAMRPEETVLVADTSSQFRQSRLFLEAVLRRTPLPRSERGLALADRFLLDPLTYQQRPVELALSGLRPRILLADVVGLGKTLEIGLILAELIRRGRGERILVVSPQQVLEQFQRELWTRFSIPLVRLDSVGIQRIQQEIPAGRNPFTYFKRAIISVDTLKDAGQFGHHLDAIDWDAVVIDESHNLINKGTKRNELAQRLARKTDALLLASATPHNGDKESFAELISLLDPAAIADKKNYVKKDIEHLYLRRTKISPEVRDQIGDRWADRGPSVPVQCAAGPLEEEVFRELTETWMTGKWSDEPVRGQHRLFPYTLLKAFLSSHKALASTVAKRLAKKDLGPTESASLEQLAGLVAAIEDDNSTKLNQLVAELKTIGVGPRSKTRAVVFSESVPTLKWLAEVLPGRLGFGPDAVRVLHGGVTDTEEQQILQDFELEGSSVRLLVTGDVASEGVNLHRQCHQLIHFDIPWSLIRIEQRNGRVDRYGQQHRPEFRALILTSQVTNAKDDNTVAAKLLVREANVHRSLGSVEAAIGIHDAEAEEDRLVKDLLEGKTVDESYEQGFEVDVLADLMAGVGETSAVADVPVARVPKLFASTSEFVEAALRELYDNRPEDAIDLRREKELTTFLAPDDLVYRLSDLPKSYLQAHREGDKLRLKVTFDRKLAQRKLDEARQAKTSSWPGIAFLSDVHPMIDWLVDKVLMRLGRQQAPVLTADVPGPVFLVQGVYANKLGQPTVVEWMAVSGLPGLGTVRPMDEVLAGAGVGPKMVNRAESVPLQPLQKMVPAAVASARDYLAGRRAEWEKTNAEPLDAYRAKLADFSKASLFSKRVEGTVREQNDLVDRLETVPDPLLRVLAVLVKPGEGAA
ncbi:DEAD/DEAH box helicase [Actinoplanes sp. TRM 88003]|uniref:DEAD/DEAH box helicase n=1 Tax=Paractinoplanes aksuensis TaxID=2939490 RepID=A0ABT1DLT5_9ACTN|nr:helicase-related protein [Actinoplanes aksuensis]MCO8271801.1 DEAD/DEAH box helicase [Actinoplanes aksuensis]